MTGRWWLFLGGFAAGLTLTIVGLALGNSGLTLFGLAIGVGLFFTRRYFRPPD